MNLIDGLDGLAGGVALVAVITTFLISLQRSHPLMMLFSSALAGAIVGFLFYNFNPASIFMGDTGSMFLGFVLAAVSLKTCSKSGTAVSRPQARNPASSAATVFLNTVSSVSPKYCRRSLWPVRRCEQILATTLGSKLRARPAPIRKGRPSIQRELARLVDAELLYQRGEPPEARYFFKHALIQEAAYQSLLRSTRQQYHQQIAQVLGGDVLSSDGATIA
jgi:hypothetical protein